MKRNDYLLYIAFIIIGLLLSYNTSFLNVQEVKAEPVNTELPTIKFDPKGNFSLDINMNNGTSTLKGDKAIEKLEITVVQPVKQQIKKEVEYVTKTEYVEKFVPPFALSTQFHVPHIELPNKFER